MYKNRCESFTNLNKRCKKIKENDSCFCCIHKPKETCSICLENIVDKFILDCKHSFCKECIFTWLSTCKTKYFYCPMCKIRVSRQIKSIAWEYGVNNDLLYRIRIIKYDISNISEEEYNQIKPFIYIYENSFIIKEVIDTIILGLTPDNFSIFKKMIDNCHMGYRLEPKIQNESIHVQEYFIISNETY